MLSAERPVLVTVDRIQREERVKTKRGFAVLRSHCFAILKASQEEQLGLNPGPNALTPHHDATNATTLVRYSMSESTKSEIGCAAYIFFQRVAESPCIDHLDHGVFRVQRRRGK